MSLPDRLTGLLDEVIVAHSPVVLAMNDSKPPTVLASLVVFPGSQSPLATRHHPRRRTTLRRTPCADGRSRTPHCPLAHRRSPPCQCRAAEPEPRRPLGLFRSRDQSAGRACHRRRRVRHWLDISRGSCHLSSHRPGYPFVDPPASTPRNHPMSSEPDNRTTGLEFQYEPATCLDPRSRSRCSAGRTPSWPGHRSIHPRR